MAVYRDAAEKLRTGNQALEIRGRRVEWSGMEEIVGHLRSEIEHIEPLLRAKAANGRAVQVAASDAL